MAYAAKILADSVSPRGHRLTTFEVTFPRIVLAEFNTHRVFSRNSASSRAIPVMKMVERVMKDPFIPYQWGKNQKGMQASEELSNEEREKAVRLWLEARDHAVTAVEQLSNPLTLNVHKQIANRLLEPFMWHTVIVTATEWQNFFNQRTHKDAQPEIQRAAALMKELYEGSTPDVIDYGEWHLPLVRGIDFEQLSKEFPRAIHPFALPKISSGRCARVSYLTHDGVRDPNADVDLCDNKLMVNGHMSPLEHPATPIREDEDVVLNTGNFRGWFQYRKHIPGESVFRQSA